MFESAYHQNVVLPRKKRVASFSPHIFATFPLTFSQILVVPPLNPSKVFSDPVFLFLSYV